ncbi:mucin-19-like [Pseudomyrmex gracilis]|uniref:mucin-19-like n=1 Tax=Pseudomyrmex gracilis TaxID=219809 RepID=UPI0009950D5B|nr:mucin-19-like [Pseudomyrmex gracilis]
MWGRKILLVLFALTALGITTKCPKRKTSPIREIFCYTSTFNVQLLADSVCSCTTLVHQNHDVRNLSISDITDLRKSLKEMHPSLQFIISIFDPAKTLVSSAMIRQEALARILAVIKEVDGVEMNITAGSKERLYNFVKSLKDEMIRKSYDKRIFLSLPTKSGDIAKQFDLKKLVKYIDIFTLPTDYMTDEDSAFVTFHPSRLMGLFDMLNPDSLIDLISGLGVPKQKILMTLPANAYKFALKYKDENAPRSETSEKEPVPIDRKQLCKTLKNGNWTVERDEDLTAPYTFQNKTWIAFEDKISVGIKGKYVLLRDLAGLGVRHIENDTKTECETPLTQEIFHSFTEFNRKTRQAVLSALEDELHQTQFSYPNQATTSSFRVVRVVDTQGHIRAVRESTQTEFVCRRQGYFVHPKSCNRFYRCVKFNQEVENYSVFEFDCPAGLSFDERTEVCVWPGSLPQGSPCPGSSEIAPVAPKRFECSKSGYYADPQNCRWFFSCMDLGGPELMAFEFRCPYGLVFDEQKLVCEWPWLVPACSESGSAYTRTEYDYRGHSAGTSPGFGGGSYVTGSLPEYSVTGGTDYSNVDYSKTTNTGIHGVNYFGSTAGHIGGHTGTSDSVGLSHGQASVDYTQSSGYRGSSIPTYYGSSDIGSVSPSIISGGQSNTRYSTSSDKVNSGHTISTHQIGTGYANTGSLGGIVTGFSGSTVQDYSGSTNGSHHFLGEHVTYSGAPVSDYSSPGGGYTGYTGSVGVTNSIVDTASHLKPGTNYFGSTGQSGSSVGVYAGSTPKYSDSSLYKGSDVFNVGGHSTSNVYSGATERRPSHGATFGVNSYPGTIGGIDFTGSINKEYTGSNTQVYGDTSGAGYSKTAGAGSSTGFGVNLSTNTGIHSTLHSSTSSDRVTGTDFISGSSKYGLTSGISTISGHSGSATADSDHFISGSTASSGTTNTGIRYNNEDGYTIPVFIQHGEPIYPLPGTGVRDHTGTTGAGGISVTNARPNFNISIFGNEIPTGYNIQKGTTNTILTGSSIQEGIFTGDSYTGTAFSHGNIPGAVSNPSVNQGAVLTGGTQPGYVVTSSGTSGYVTGDGVKTVDGGSASLGTLTYGTPTPAISLTGPSTPGTVLKHDITPGVIISGQTAPGISVGYSTQPGIIKSSTGPQSTYHGIGGINTVTGGSVTSNNIQSGGVLSTNLRDYKTDEGHSTATFNVAYDTNKYLEKDIPDYRPTSATLPDIIVPGGRIEGGGGVVSSTLAPDRVATAVSGYSPTKSAVFTPSGFTKTGPTRTGITTAILGGGGSYSISTGDRRPTFNPENISEKAFEGNVAGYTKTSSINNAAGSVSATLTPTSYSSTVAPGGSVSQSVPSGYSYPKPTVQLGTSGVTFPSSSISPIRDYSPVTTPTPFGKIDGSSDNVFGFKIPTVSTDRRVPISTITPTIYTTKYPDTYKSTLYEAAIPSTVSTVKPLIDTDYKTVVSTNIPVSISTDDRFIQQTDISQTGSIATSSIGVGKVPSQRPVFSTVSTGQKDYTSFTSRPISSEYLPAKPSKSGTATSTTKYDIPAVTQQPELGVTYKKPSSVHEGPFSVILPTTFRPSDVYYPDQGFTSPSSVETTPSGGSPINLDITRDKIDKLITNYDRGTVKYTPSVYDDFTSSGFDSTKTFSSSSSSPSKSSFSVKTGGTLGVTTPSFSPILSYEVTTKSPEGKGKVIVKWSDLHPLLLGKLGAECTCKADPFATLRGPIRKLIDSSRGKVDLANYDESEIYVDLENDSGSKENDYITDYGHSSPQPYKLSPLKTTSVTTGSTKLPSSSYLSVPSTTLSSRYFDISTGTFGKADEESSRLQIDVRTGKKLTDINTSLSTSDERREEEDDDPDQIIDGATNCARPGLFRHPSLCNKFYACHWDQWKKKFTLHIFNCPIHLTFDSSASACNWPSKGPTCQADNLLV